MTTWRGEGFAKFGIVFPETEWKSIGFQANFIYHDQRGFIGLNGYRGIQKSGFFNAIYQQIHGLITPCRIDPRASQRVALKEAWIVTLCYYLQGRHGAQHPAHRRSTNLPPRPGCRSVLDRQLPKLHV